MDGNVKSPIIVNDLIIRIHLSISLFVNSLFTEHQLHSNELGTMTERVDSPLCVEGR